MAAPGQRDCPRSHRQGFAYRPARRADYAVERPERTGGQLRSSPFPRRGGCAARAGRGFCNSVGGAERVRPGLCREFRLRRPGCGRPVVVRSASTTNGGWQLGVSRPLARQRARPARPSRISLADPRRLGAVARDDERRVHLPHAAAAAGLLAQCLSSFCVATSLVCVVTAALSRRLADRLGRRVVFLGGYVLLGIVYVMLLAPGTGVWGAAMGILALGATMQRPTAC